MMKEYYEKKIEEFVQKYGRNAMQEYIEGLYHDAKTVISTMWIYPYTHNITELDSLSRDGWKVYSECEDAHYSIVREYENDEELSDSDYRDIDEYMAQALEGENLLFEELEDFDEMVGLYNKTVDILDKY